MYQPTFKLVACFLCLPILICTAAEAQDPKFDNLVLALRQMNLTPQSGDDAIAQELFAKWMYANGESEENVKTLLELIAKANVRDQFSMFVAGRDFLFPVAPIQFPETKYHEISNEHSDRISGNVMRSLLEQLRGSSEFRRSYCQFAIWNRQIDFGGIFSPTDDRIAYFSVRHPFNTSDFKSSFLRLAARAKKLDAGESNRLGLDEIRILLPIVLYCYLAGEFQIQEAYDNQWTTQEIQQIATSLESKLDKVSFRLIAAEDGLTMRSHELLSRLYGAVEVIVSLAAYGVTDSPIVVLRWDGQTFVGNWPPDPLPNWK